MNVTENIDNSWASESLRRHSGWMLALGILMFLLGMIGLVDGDDPHGRERARVRGTARRRRHRASDRSVS